MHFVTMNSHKAILLSQVYFHESLLFIKALASLFVYKL